MAEDERPRIGLKTGLQAGAFIGLFLGFSLAVVSALTQPDALVQLVQLMCITPVVCAIFLGPFLGLRRAPQVSSEDPIEALRELLKPFNEGQVNGGCSAMYEAMDERYELTFTTPHNR